MASKIITTGGGGVTSCLSVRLSKAIDFYTENNCFPDEIDSSSQFGYYRDYFGQDISKIILGEYKPDNSLKYVGYNHGWQFSNYDEIELPYLSKLAENICPMSSLIGDKSYGMIERVDGRTALLYRGNDKCLDIPRTNYQHMIEIALETGSKRFIVQTDENDFYNFFKERFPDTICFEEVPRIDKDPDAFVMPEVGKRVDFCVTFLAAIRAIAQAPKLILNTGNTGIWTMLFRGHTKDVWQIHGGNQQCRKLK